MKIIFTSQGVRTINFHEELESKAEDNLIDLQGERVKEKQIRFYTQFQMRKYLNCSRTSYRILVKLHIKKRKLSANIISLKLHAQPRTAADSSTPDFYLNRQVLESALILVHFKAAAISLIKGDVTFWELSAHLSMGRKGRELQNTLSIILLINLNQKRNTGKYLVNPETITTAYFYGSMKVHSQFQLFNSRPEKLSSRCQWTTRTLTPTPDP